MGNVGRREMRVLRLHPFLRSEVFNSAAGGMGRVSLQLTLLLLRAGVDARVFPLPERLLDRQRWDLAEGQSVTVEPTMAIPNIKGLVKALPRAFRLVPRAHDAGEFRLDIMSVLGLQRALASFAPQLIHNHVARAPFPRLARGLGLSLPTVLTHHHGDAGERLEYYTRVVFNCRATQDRISRSVGLAPDKTRVVYHPVAPPFAQGRVFPAEGRDTIVFVGAVRERKGIDLLLDAWSQSPRLRRLRVRVFGGGPEALRYMAMAAERRLPVEFVGAVSPTELRAALDEALLVVVPSRLESFSRALSEAVCAGVPVVGWPNQINEMREVLGIEPGWPFDAQTAGADDLANVVLAALRSPSLGTRHRRALAAAGRRFFSEEQFVNGYLDIYREVA